MKALFISSDPSIFEEGSATRARMREYAAAIGELHILSRLPAHSGAARARDEQDGTLHLHAIRASKLLAPLSLARRAHALVRENGIEVVSAQDPFEHGWAAERAIRGTGAKLHIQVHTDVFSPWFLRSGMARSAVVPAPFLNRLRRRIADRLLPRAGGIRAVSLRVKESLIARYGTRIRTPSVIPVAIASAVPAPAALPPHEFSFAFVAVSRLAPEKRIEDILHALARVAYHLPEVGLFVIGEGRERPKLEARVKRLGLEKRVIFLGERADARALLGSASAFIQASAYEGYGRTLIEAALARVPIITTDVGIVGEVLRGYEEALVAPVADPAALATHIRGIVADHTVRLALAMKAEIAAKAHLAASPDQPRLIAEDLARLVEKGIGGSMLPGTGPI